MGKIQAFDFDIEYVKGKNNVVADALSRKPAICLLTQISADWKAHLLVEYSKNTSTCKLMDSDTQDDRCKVVDDIIYCKDQIYLVPKSKLKQKILKEIHDSPLARHPSSKPIDNLRRGSRGKDLKTIFYSAYKGMCNMSTK